MAAVNVTSTLGGYCNSWGWAGGARERAKHAVRRWHNYIDAIPPPTDAFLDDEFPVNRQRTETYTETYNSSTMPTMKTLPRTAAIVAFVIAGIFVLVGLLGPIVILPFAIIPLCAGVGILRKRVWSAYGFATYLFAQLLIVLVILVRPGFSAGIALQFAFSAMGSLLLGILYLSAGRSLAASGATRGRAFPWIVVAALSIAPFFFVRPFEVAAGSMEDTLLPGDRILAQTFPLRSPERGKIVLFLSPADRSQTLIKRVIAIPGDRLRIAQNVVILNGTALDEKYVTHEAGEEDPYGDDFPNDFSIPECAEGHKMLSQQVVNGEIVVPAGEYFVLGDRREISLDSRCWGFVRTSDLIGKPLMIYDSIDRTATQESSPSQGWRGHRRWTRLFTVF
jgi:signal peptidase I